MAANDYHLRGRWRVLGSVEEVYDVISRTDDLPRWWPAMFLETLPIPSGDEDAARVTRVESRGWLPYVHRWHAAIEEADEPGGLAIQVWGDFKGRIAWRFAQADARVDVTVEWDVEARKPVERYVSVVLKPLFAASLAWALSKGEESLRLELARRHADERQRRLLAAPPAAAHFPIRLALTAAGLIGVLAWRGGKKRPI